MRLFTGIDLPEDIAANLNRLLDLLRPTAHLKWTPLYNFHLTTKFIGPWPDAKLDDLIGHLRVLQNRPAIDSVHVKDIGWFPNPRAPKILWAGIVENSDLSSLATETDTVTEQLQVPKETKPFAPHLTLARIKEAAPLGPLQQAITKLESTDFGTFAVDRFFLYESKPGPSGSIYTKLAEFPLKHA